MKNPIKSSYNLLWQEINNRDENSGITIQNTMRRIIENYFKVLGRYGDDDLIQKFKDKEEQIICRSLISWINDGSHSFSDDLFIEAQDDIIEKYLTVFKGIFEKTGFGQPNHTLLGRDWAGCEAGNIRHGQAQITSKDQ